MRIWFASCDGCPPRWFETSPSTARRGSGCICFPAGRCACCRAVGSDGPLLARRSCCSRVSEWIVNIVVGVTVDDDSRRRDLA